MAKQISVPVAVGLVNPPHIASEPAGRVLDYQAATNILGYVERTSLLLQSLHDLLAVDNTKLARVAWVAHLEVEKAGMALADAMEQVLENEEVVDVD